MYILRQFLIMEHLKTNSTQFKAGDKMRAGLSDGVIFCHTYGVESICGANDSVMLSLLWVDELIAGVFGEARALLSALFLSHLCTV